MSVAIKGTTYTTGAQVTATNLNALVDSLTFDTGAVDNSTTQLSGGSIIVKDKGISEAKLESGSNGQLFIGNGTGFTKATLTAGTGVSITNAAGSITIAAGISSTLNSDLALSSGVYKESASANELVFDSANAPSVTLTTGTWLLSGTCSVQAYVDNVPLWLRFWNNTDSAAFGGGATGLPHTTITSMSANGVYTVASGSKVIYFKLYSSGSPAALRVGNTASYAGYIQAVRIA